MSSSRIPAFYQLSVEERRLKLVEVLGLSVEDAAVLADDGLPLEIADILRKSYRICSALWIVEDARVRIRSGD